VKLLPRTDSSLAVGSVAGAREPAGLANNQNHKNTKHPANPTQKKKKNAKQRKKTPTQKKNARARLMRPGDVIAAVSYPSH